MRSDRERIEDITEAIKSIEEYSLLEKENLFKDKLVQVWMVHHILLIGEATSGLSEELRKKNPEIPWRKINAYMATVYETLNPKAYSDAQDDLAKTEGGAAVIWGYQWWVTPGYEELGINHEWHTKAAMNGFAAPLDHKAWSIYGWRMGGAYKCNCYRQIITWDTAIERGWAMMQLVGKDANGNDVFKPVTLKREPVKQFKNEWVNQLTMIEMRNFLVHEYFGIDLNEVWRTMKSDIPELKIWLEDLSY